MTSIKVVTINVCYDVLPKDETYVSDTEKDGIKKYLEEGFIVKDRFTTTTAIDNSLNITFVLERETP